MLNTKRYAPPEGYYETTKDRKPSPYLVKAISLMDPIRGVALDFGCGAGSDTRFLLENGFSVETVDGNKEAEKFIKQLPHQENVTFVCSDFENYKFKSYNLINSARSLPFVHKDHFKDVMARLVESLQPNGIFVGEFYGDKDEWNKPGETMTFVNSEEVEALLRNLNLLTIEESEYDGAIANGKPKHWHTIHVLARKPSLSEPEIGTD